MTSLAQQIARHQHRLAILAHHYQADAIVEHAHFVGDSLELARQVTELAAEHIVFCGVHFMAESAAILARPEQKVHAPVLQAGCVMANMAPAPLVEAVLARLTRSGARVIPLTYVNSSAAIKAVVGRAGGAVCTSANAQRMLQWALEQGDCVLFLPDANLGANTARAIGLPQTSIERLDICAGGLHVPAAQADVRVYLWPGCCAVHHKIRLEDIQAVRAKFPQARILVHPECRPEVVAAADGAGSTSYLIREAAQTPAGSTLAIGTEDNLVARLARRHPEVRILPVRRVLCSNMAKTDVHALTAKLQELDTAQPVRVDAATAAAARLALERMLTACAPPNR
ncbi:quinolinate synthetase [Thermodesulfomicrobium sp. WS]|uniref:quinolinate synthase NadA n=1 Tax=Thermodesulfomicrobium sp. WS TaxID=3004129 RepID=UPI002492C52D|nr:quinolinate synthase NadA [Thermodesulfomicrobium sp. WS]BDV01415.1 quinolinate synthetase [Thermodesulfomicrobium sp. WS]